MSNEGNDLEFEDYLYSLDDEELKDFLPPWALDETRGEVSS